MGSETKGGFGRLKPSVNKTDDIRVANLVKLLQNKPNKWVTVRFLPSFVLPVLNIWFEAQNKEGKAIRFAKIATNFDPRTDDFTGEDCPYQDAGGKASKEYYANAIIP